MLSTERDIDFYACQNPVKAIQKANQITPTVILQDLVMPEVDGLTLVQYFRVNPATRDVPLIVLSVKEEAHIKAAAFSLEANDYMVKFPDRQEVIARIRYHSRGYINLLQKNDVYERLALSMREEQERTRELALQTEMSELLQACQSEKETYDVVANIYTRLLPDYGGFLCLLDTRQTTMCPVVTWGTLPFTPREFGVDACRASHRGKVYVNKAAGPHSHCPLFPARFRSEYLCVPIRMRGDMLGTIHLVVNEEKTASPHAGLLDSKQFVIARIAEHYVLILVNLRLRDTLKIESIHDPLTNLYNRRYMKESLEREVPRAIRHQTHVGIIMIDIDHFKHFNDTYGHGAGDLMLQAVSAYLKAQVRAEDIVCRYGGEEILLILPDIELDDLAKRASNLCTGVKNHVEILYETTTLSVTISLGVASFPDHGKDIREVLKAVDIALYQAKKQGRNQSVTATRQSKTTTAT